MKKTRSFSRSNHTTSMGSTNGERLGHGTPARRYSVAPLPLRYPPRRLQVSARVPIDTGHRNGSHNPSIDVVEPRPARGEQPVSSEFVTLVVSVPKSGTHFLGAILDQIGVAFSGYFFVSATRIITQQAKAFGSNRACQYLLAPGRPHHYGNEIDIDVHAFFNMVPAGTHVLSHTTPRDIPFTLLPRLRILFLWRRLRETLISGFKAAQMVWQMHIADRATHFRQLDQIFLIEREETRLFDPNKSVQDTFYDYLNKVCPVRKEHLLDILYWRYYTNVCALRFEEIIAGDVPAIMRVAAFLDQPIDAETARALISTAKAAETPTKSATPLVSGAKPVWDERCEGIFLRHRLDLIEAEFDAFFAVTQGEQRHAVAG